MDITNYADSSTAVDVARSVMGIDRPIEQMDEDDIRAVCVWIGARAPDTMVVNGKVVLGKIGIGVMLFIAILEFPRFYEKYELWQRN